MTLEWQGLQSVIDRYEGIADRTANPESILIHARRTISKSIARNFSAAGRPDPWPRRVSNAAGQFRYPDTQTHPLLNKTSRMVAAAVSQTDGGESVARLERHSLAFGLSVPYAIYHVSLAPRTKIPRRNFMLFQPEDIAVIIGYTRGFAWWGSV